MRFLVLTISFLISGQVFAAECDRDIRVLERALPGEYLLLGIAGVEVESRPTGFCKDIPDHFVLRHGGCDRAFEALGEKMADSMEYACYQTGQIYVKMILGDQVEESRQPV